MPLNQPKPVQAVHLNLSHRKGGNSATMALTRKPRISCVSLMETFSLCLLAFFMKFLGTSIVLFQNYLNIHNEDAKVHFEE
jgi:hypothetical protein